MTGGQGQVPDGWPAANRDNMTWIPKYDYPAVRDTKAAVRWLRANADTYGVDASKIAMFGDSAGACSADGVAMVREEDYKGELTAVQDPTLVSKMMNFAFKTKNCVSKTRNFVFKMMNFAGLNLPGAELCRRRGARSLGQR